MADHLTRPLRHKGDRSPWPLLIGVAAPLVGVAAVLASVAVGLVAGALLVVGVGGWLLEAGREHEAGRPGTEGEHPRGDWWQRRTRPGLFLAAGLVADAAFLAAGFRMLVAHGLLDPAGWPAAARTGIGLPATMSVLLVLAAGVAQWTAGRGIDVVTPRHLLVGAAAAGALGVAFLALLGRLWARYAEAGFAPTSGPAASVHAWLTGYVAAHVVAAIAFFALLVARAYAGHLPVGHRHAEATAGFWIATALLWLVIAALTIAVPNLGLRVP